MSRIINWLPALLAAGAVACDGTPVSPERGSVSGRAWMVEDGSPLAQRQVTLLRADDTIATTLTDALGAYAFDGVEAGDYAVAIDSMGLEPFGRFSDGREQPITVRSGQDLGADFEYRRARVTMRTTVGSTTAPAGTVVTVTLEVDVSEVPVPLATLNGTVSWPASVAGFVEGSESHGSWDHLVVNEDPVGTLRVAAISVAGLGSDVIMVFSFSVLAEAAGSAEFLPTLSELQAIDSVSGTTMDLLAITTRVEERGVVDVH